MPLTAVEDARTQIENSLAAWDWSSYFPSDYDPTLVKGVQILDDWPSDQQKNFETTANGMLTLPIVSIININPGRPAGNGDGAALGNVFGAGIQNPLLLQRGHVLTLTFQIDCWADLQIGAGPQAERLAGGVLDWIFLNENSLSSFRRLKPTSGGRPMYVDGSQLWRSTVTVEGRLVHSYDG